jgi:ParB-like chromosome segregation protein Spo0J
MNSSTLVGDGRRTAALIAAAIPELRAISAPHDKAALYAAYIESLERGLAQLERLDAALAAHELQRARDIALETPRRGSENDDRAAALGLPACAENPIPSG